MRIVKQEDGTAIDADTGMTLVKTGQDNWRAKGPLMHSESYVNEATGETDMLIEQIEDAPSPLEPV